MLISETEYITWSKITCAQCLLECFWNAKNEMCAKTVVNRFYELSSTKDFNWFFKSYIQMTNVSSFAIFKYCVHACYPKIWQVNVHVSSIIWLIYYFTIVFLFLFATTMNNTWVQTVHSVCFLRKLKPFQWTSTLHMWEGLSIERLSKHKLLAVKALVRERKRQRQSPTALIVHLSND